MKIKVFALLMILLLMLGGCGSKDVQKDLIDYYNNGLAKVSALEKEAVDAYTGVSGSNYQNDSIMHDAMTKTVIPRYGEFKKQLEGIHPKTKEVKELHKIYVEAAKEQYDAFVMIVDALEKQDSSLIDQANEKLDKGVELINAFKAKMDELFKKYDVEIKN